MTTVALPVLAVALGLAVAPMAISVLDVEDYVRYEQTLGLRPADAEVNATAELPQHFADRFGWRELTDAVAGVVSLLPEVERRSLLIVTGNYGECGALNYYGPEHGLPTAVSGHNSCFLWWPQDLTPAVAVVVGGSREWLEEIFTDVRLGGTNRADWAMPYEGEVPIWVCRGPKRSWNELRLLARSAA